VGGVEGFEVFAAADEEVFGLPLLGACLEGGSGDGCDDRAEAELDSIALGEEGWEVGEDLAGVYGEFGGAADFGAGRPGI